jgi:hypothetical protein
MQYVAEYEKVEWEGTGGREKQLHECFPSALENILLLFAILVDGRRRDALQ